MITRKQLFKYVNAKPTFFIVLGGMVALAVFLLLLYANLGILNITGYFDAGGAYKDSILLFFHEDCLYCSYVDTYVANNAVEKKIPFIKLNVDNQYNENVLEDKVQICGLDKTIVGVPFLWDGPNKKCILGYVDIISFFRQQMAKKPK